MFRRAYSDYERLCGAKHPNTLFAATNLGRFLCTQARLDEAAPLLERALELRQENFGDLHLESLESLFEVGVLRQAQGQLSAAATAFARVLQTREAQLGAEHSQTRAAASALAACLELNVPLCSIDGLDRLRTHMGHGIPVAHSFRRQVHQK